MLTRIKRIIPERHKGPLLAATGSSHDADLNHFRGRPKVIVGLGGFYQNLGDMALTFAHKRFIETTLPDHEVVVVPSVDTYRKMRALKSICDQKDLITLVGGGNMDDLYSSLENCRRFYVRSFPNNPVVSFPQTISFSATSRGKRAKMRTARTYAHHRRMTIFGREPRSLAMMTETFPDNDVRYSPDIVLSLRLEDPATERSGVLVCMRQDHESRFTFAQRQSVIDTVQARYDDVLVRDTADVALDECTPETYEATLHAFWDLLRTRRVVVTDRLHGMIFCAITRTPCVVLPNSNHKIESTYDACLADLPHITYLDHPDPQILLETISRLSAIDLDQVPALNLSSQFDDLQVSLRRAAGL